MSKVGLCGTIIIIEKKIEGQYLILFGCVSVGKITYDQQYAKGRKKFPEEVKPKRNLSNQNNSDGNEICSTVMSLKKFEKLICLFFRFYKKIPQFAIFW